MKRSILAGLLLWAGSTLAAEQGIRFQPDQIVWKPASASLPAGAEIAVLEGDPKGKGLFTMRVKLPAGSRLDPHWHPKPERVTVISGAAAIGLGEKFDEALLKDFPAGSYYLTPPGVPHFARFTGQTVLQVTTEGPWELHKLPSAP